MAETYLGTQRQVLEFYQQNGNEDGPFDPEVADEFMGDDVALERQQHAFFVMGMIPKLQRGMIGQDTG